MQLTNQQFALLQNSRFFWENRFVFWNETSQVDKTQIIQDLDKLKFQEQTDEWGNTIDQQIDELTDTPELKKKALIETVANVWKEWIEQDLLFDVLDNVEVDFKNIESKIAYGKMFNTLVEAVKEDIQADGDLDKNYASKNEYLETNDTEKTLTEWEKKRVVFGMQEALASESKVEWFGKVEFSDEILNQMFNAILQNKTNPEQSDADYLKTQFKNPDSPESQILMQGYTEIIKKLEVNSEEKATIKELLVSCGEPYKRLADNENLQNIISRNFDITQSEKGEFILVNHLKSAENKTNPLETIKHFLDQQFPEIAKLKTEEEKLPQELLAQIKGKDLLQADSLENIKEKISQATDTNKEKSFFENLQEIIELLRDFFAGNFNVNKIEGLMQWVKLQNTKSKENDFDMTYTSEKPPSEEWVFGYLKGKTLTLNQGKNNEKRVKIEKAEQLNIFENEDGKIRFTVKENAEAWKIETQKETKQNTKLNGINWENAKQIMRQLNQKDSVELGKIWNRNIFIQNSSGIALNEFSIEKGKIYLWSEDSGKTEINLSVNQDWELDFNVNPVTPLEKQLSEKVNISFNKTTDTIELTEKPVENYVEKLLS